MRIARRDVRAVDIRIAHESQDCGLDGFQRTGTDTTLVEPPRNVEQIQMRAVAGLRKTIHDVPTVECRNVEGFPVERDEERRFLDAPRDVSEQRLLLGWRSQKQLLDDDRSVLEPRKPDHERNLA